MIKRLLFLAFLITGMGCKGQTGNRQAAYEFNKRLGRGINFMASKINQDYQSPEDFKLIRKNKFTHVRIGSLIWKDTNTGGAPDYIINQEKLQEYQNAVDWALQQKLMVVVDPIHSWTFYTNDDLPKLLQLWKQISTRFAKYPLDSVAFEIFNEPHSYAIDLKAMLQGCINTIRSIPGNEKRMIIVSGQSFSTRQALIDAFDNNVVFPTNDPYLIATYHYYDPRKFTKQGSTGNVYWASLGDNDPAWDVVSQDFDEVVNADNNWAAKNHTSPLPVYCGEYGVDNGAPAADRTRWLWWIRMMCEERGFSNSIWNLYGDNPTSKGMGPWTSAQKADPSARYLNQNVLIPYCNRYEGEQAEITGSFFKEPWKGSSDDSVVSTNHGKSGDQIKLSNVYIAHKGTYDITFRFLNEATDTITVTLVSGFNYSRSDSVYVKLPPTGNHWTSVTLPLFFASSIKDFVTLRLNTSASSFHFDYLAITKEAYYDNLFPSLEINPIILENPLEVVNKSFSNVRIYPNPTRGNLTIKGRFKNWILCSSIGVPLLSSSYPVISMSKFPQGLYFLVIDNMTHKVLYN